MSLQTGPVSAVLPTGSTLPAAEKTFSSAYVLSRFDAAPAVADTSVSRQTGLAGIRKKSSDPASLTLTQQSGVTSKTITNTLVVRPKNLRAAVITPPVQFVRSSASVAKVSS